MNTDISLHQSRSWTNEEVKLLCSWGDKAACFKWMHNQSHKQYYCKNAWITIPVIVLCAITGTANFAQGGTLSGVSSIYIPWIIGSFNLIAAIISTIAQFLNISERVEGHRVATISWGKFSRRIKVELTRRDRISTNKFDKFLSYQEEYD